MDEATREGSGNGAKGAGAQAEKGFRVSDSYPCAMGLTLSSDPGLGTLDRAKQCPLVPSLGVCDGTALDFLEMCPMVQECPLLPQQCPLFTKSQGPVPDIFWSPGVNLKNNL